MKGCRYLVGTAIILATTAGAAGLYWYVYLSPIVLRLAAAPVGGETATFFATLARISEAEKLRVRIVLAPLNNLAETPAVIRSFADLRGRRIGVLGRGPANRALLGTLAAYHGLPNGEVTIVPLTEVAEVAAQARAGAIEGVFLAPPRGDQLIGAVLAAMTCPADRSLAIVPLTEGSVFQARNRIFSSVEIVAGEFVANPTLPSEAMSTLAFASILVARRGLSSDVVEEFTKQLFTLRHGLMSQYPAAARLEPLPTDRGSAFTLHPGAAADYDGETKSFFERYETLIYILLFGFSGILSGLVWIWRSLFPTRRLLVHEEHHAFEALIARARQAGSQEELDALVAEMDALLAVLSRNMLDGRIDLDLKPAFDILSERLETAIRQRRAWLAQAQPAAAGDSPAG